MAFIDSLATNTTQLAISLLFLGLFVGSFLNVVIHRLPLMMEREWRSQCAEYLGVDPAGEADTEPLTLANPRSRCPKCGYQLRVVENIPLVSFLFLKGKCSGCGASISFRYPLVEFISAVLVVILAWHFGWGWPLLGACLLTWALIALSAIDLDHQLLPDAITQPFLWLGLIFNLFGTYSDLESCVIGAIAGYTTLWLVYRVFKFCTGKEGMGFGDFKLLAMLGAWMGWQQLPLIIVLSSFVGALVGVSLMVLKEKDKNSAIPFGPYLACAGWIAFLWGDPITERYVEWLQ